MDTQGRIALAQYTALMDHWAEFLVGATVWETVAVTHLPCGEYEELDNGSSPATLTDAIQWASGHVCK